MLRAVILLTVVAAAFAASVHGPRRNFLLRRQIKIKDDNLDQIKTLLDKMVLDDILEPSRKRVCEDSDIQILVTYAKSDAFQKRIEAIVNLPEVQDLIEQVLNSGADIQKFTNFIQSFLNCPTGLRKLRTADQDELYRLLELVKLDDVAPLYHDRLLKEADLVKLLDVFNQGKGKEDLDKVVQSQAFKDIEDDIVNAGADQARCLTLFSQLTGINLPIQKSIRLFGKSNDALADIKALLDKMVLDDILEPSRKRVCEDSDIQILVTYAKSDAFQKRIEAIVNLAEVQDLIELVLNSGADVQKFTNFIQSFLNCPTGLRSLKTADQDQLYKLLEQVKLDDVAPLYHDRLLKEADLVKLLDVFNQGQGKADLDKVVQSQAFKDIEDDIVNAGADQARCLTLFSQLTGIDLPIQKFLRLLSRFNGPLDDIKALLDKMVLDDILDPSRKRVCEDPDVQILVTYAKSDAFQKRIEALVNLPEVQDLIELVLNSGADIQKFTNFIQSFLNCPTGLRKLRTPDQDQLYKLLEQVKLDDVAPLYHDRLLKEADLVKLLDVFNKGQGKDDLDKVVQSPAFKDIENDIVNAGADEERCLTLFSQLTGIDLPIQH